MPLIDRLVEDCDGYSDATIENYSSYSTTDNYSFAPFPDCSVLIIGAGPTGLVAASELLRQGINDFVILERNLIPVIASKGNVLAMTTLEKLDFYGKTTSKLISWGTKLDQFQYESNGRDVIKINSMREYDFGKYNYVLGCEQWVTEKALTEHLDENGIEIHRGVNVLQVQDLNDKVLVSYQHDGQVYTLFVKYVIACDGAKSSVRKSLGIDFVGTTQSCTTVQLHYDDCGSFQDLDKTNFMMHLGCKSGTFVIPANQGVFVYMDLNPKEHLVFTSDKLDKYGYRKVLPISPNQIHKILCQRINAELPLGTIIWSTHFRVNNRVASSYWNKSRIFIAGDAAHSSSPIAGLGLNFGVEDALNLSWKIGHVLGGKATASILETYDAERRSYSAKLLMNFVQQTLGIFKAPFGKLFRNRMLQFLFKIPFVVKNGFKAGAGLNFTLPRITTQNIYAETYSLSGLIRQCMVRFKRNYVYAGNRFNEHAIHDLYPNFVSSTSGFKIVLFSFPKSILNPLSSEEVNEVCKQLQKLDVITNFIMIDQTMKNIHSEFGVLGQSVILIRPDGYIGLRSEVLSIKIVEYYLQNVMHLILK
jgi:2-polyprenyl-6-methoxyphenol hydroxylase-like FAD-dependent oxidoreductase